LLSCLNTRILSLQDGTIQNVFYLISRGCLYASGSMKCEVF
jgi:hypothetical protein